MEILCRTSSNELVYEILPNIFLFFSILFPKEDKKISVNIYNYDNPDWWSNYNNSGLNFTKSNISLSYKNIFDDYELLINTHASDEKIIFSESYISFSMKKVFKIKFGRYYRDFSTYLNDELSSGSMLIGKNALPIPKIGLLGEYYIKKKINLNFHMVFHIQFLKKMIFIMNLHLYMKNFCI